MALTMEEKQREIIKARWANLLLIAITTMIIMIIMLIMTLGKYRKIFIMV